MIIEGTTGAQLLGQCDLRRLQTLRDANHGIEMDAVLKPAPFTVGLEDPLVLPNRDGRQKYCATIVKIDAKASKNFLATNANYLQAFALVGAAETGLVDGIRLQTHRNLGLLACSLQAAFPNTIKLKAAKADIEKFTDFPLAADVGFTQLRIKDVPSKKEEEEYSTIRRVAVRQMDPPHRSMRLIFPRSPTPRLLTPRFKCF
jgi:hypothetical protein